MSIRPSMRGASRRSVRWSTALASGSGAPSGPRSSASAGRAPAIASSAKAAAKTRSRPRSVAAVIALACPFAITLPRRSSDPDILVIRRQPAPGTRAVAALRDALLVDLADDLAVAGEQRLGRAHLGTHRQLALAEAV